MPENVRLVIWDLDETFWEGTLSEEGITRYIDKNHETVIELARRGIMSSICSKNDFETVKTILTERGLWDYFVFPSIDWMPKAARIHQIVENFQLRTASVMFIDDNHGNRAEVQARFPDLQIEDETFVSRMLSDSRFAGKNDAELSRLKQYKVLEQKASDKSLTGGDNASFLRQSGIIVEIEHDVEKYIDRAVELVNRTNQLNFTKNRLPDDPEQALAEMRRQITDLPYARTVGLVKVRDNYGDYGICGFYLCEQIHEWFVLKHFCFSCRILGMGVEHWLYDKIGRPYLGIVGEVLSDPHDDIGVDWINNTSTPQQDSRTSAAFSSVRDIYLRGGCDLDAVGHYLRYVAKNIVSDTNIVRDENLIRRDSLTNIVSGLRSLSPEQTELVTRLGFDPAVFHADFLRQAGPGDVILLSLAADVTVTSYQSVDDPSFILLMQIRGIFHDLVSEDAAVIRESMRHVNWDEELQEKWWSRVGFLRNHFHSFGIHAGYYDDLLKTMLGRLHEETMMVIIMPSLKFRDNSGQIVINERAAIIRDSLTRLCGGLQNVRLVDIMDTVDDDNDFVDGDHVKRQAYFRLYQLVEGAIAAMIESFGTPALEVTSAETIAAQAADGPAPSPARAAGGPVLRAPSAEEHPLLVRISRQLGRMFSSN